VSIVSGVLGMGRRFSELRMTETVTVGLYTDGTDPVTGDPTRVLSVTNYSGVGQIKYPSLSVSESDGAGQQVASADVVLKVPVESAPDVRAGDEVLVSASTADGSLVGRRFRVKAWPQTQSGQVTAHRFPLEELS
jgi:hypothetical protein